MTLIRAFREKCHFSFTVDFSSEEASKEWKTNSAAMDLEIVSSVKSLDLFSSREVEETFEADHIDIDQYLDMQVQEQDDDEDEEDNDYSEGGLNLKSEPQDYSEGGEKKVAVKKRKAVVTLKQEPYDDTDPPKPKKKRPIIPKVKKTSSTSSSLKGPRTIEEKLKLLERFDSLPPGRT